MTGQSAETVHYLAEVKRRGLRRRSIRVLATLATDGTCSFELLGHKDVAPADAIMVEDRPAMAPGWPKGPVMARDVTPEREALVMAGPVWTSFAARSLRERVTYTASRIEERGRTLQLTASVADLRQAIARDGLDYPTRPPELAAAVFNIAEASTPAPQRQIPSVF